MRKTLLALAITMIFSLNTFAGEQKLQFSCGSTNKPAYEFPIDLTGSVIVIENGHLSSRVDVDEFPHRNGDVIVNLGPFHPYCSVVLEYTNHTNNVFKSGTKLLFSKHAKLRMSCEGEVYSDQYCSIQVN